MLEKTGKKLLNAASWKKFPRPVFSAAPGKKVFAPGHNCFFKSPDGKEDWILYHANSEPLQGCGRFRSPRAPRFTWTADGAPEFGEPVAEKIPLNIPSGSTETKAAAIINK
jgi:GH43 family beta-xylosidase